MKNVHLPPEMFEIFCKKLGFNPIGFKPIGSNTIVFKRPDFCFYFLGLNGIEPLHVIWAKGYADIAWFNRPPKAVELMMHRGIFLPEFFILALLEIAEQRQKAEEREKLAREKRKKEILSIGTPRPHFPGDSPPQRIVQKLLPSNPLFGTYGEAEINGCYL